MAAISHRLWRESTFWTKTPNRQVEYKRLLERNGLIRSWRGYEVVGGAFRVKKTV